MDFLTGPFQLQFVQRGLFEVLLLSIGAGLLGTWIVLRGLAFFSHAVGTAAFPGLVLADGLGFAAPLGALASAVIFAGGVSRLSGARRSGDDSVTALVLTGALALGVILASDVFHSGSNIETLLFGSLLVLEPRDLAIAGAVSAASLIVTAAVGRTWLATGFDPSSARLLGLRSRLPEAILLLLIALVVIASLSALGALLATTLLLVPAATVRLVVHRLELWQLGAVALTAIEGTAGLWLSVKLNAPPGPTIAVLGGAVFAITASTQALVRRGRGASVPVALAAVAALVLGGCAGSSGGSSGGKLDVVATTTQIGDWARAVGGDAVDVHQILKPNSDPHEYEPRPGDVQATSGAAVVFTNGDELDSWAKKLIDQAGGKPRTVDLGAGVPVRLPGERSGPEASRYDPHWWHDARNAVAAVEQIRDALVSAAPSRRGTIERNAGRYLSKLRALDRAIGACIARLPADQRKLVTDHDAFGYFAKRYGLEVVGAVIPSQTTQAQASAADVTNLTNVIRRERVRAIFPESSLNAKLAHAIARETGAKSGATLYGDTLGPKDSRGGTYLTMEAANAESIASALGGDRVRCAIPAT